MINENDLRVLKVFKCLSNSTRFEIIRLLINSSYSVGKLSELLKKEIPNISQHLKIMRDLNIVSYRTIKNEVMYSLKNESVVRIIEVAEDILSRH
ncbi:MAG TPA: metalloregulator ArsR/SmtB family transcription factor [bacterium]|nr:metalloregulator ArsR/SmtB family transcription factor [bacterium]HPN29462.1 metalloregulator ArsR/SmtB family transcription factor [bacterium]